MRLSLFALPLLLSLNACATSQFAEGSVSYTSSPAAPASSGALSLEMRVCNGTTSDDHTLGVQLGGACTLIGDEETTNARRWGGTGGAMAELESLGRCWLPMHEGEPLHVAVRHATYHREGDAIDVVVGGSTDDGRYMTYRFTGSLAGNDSSNACDGTLNPPRRKRASDPL